MTSTNTPRAPADWLCFSNPGELDLQALTLFGASAKPQSSNPIGHFGTGLKYALATLARLGAAVQLHIGTQRLVLRKQPDEFRGKEIQKLYLDDLDTNATLLLPFTTALGQNWSAWWAYRELWANCTDEGGAVQAGKTPGAVQAAGQTCFFIHYDAMYEIWLNEDQFICSSDTALWQTDEVSVHTESSTLLAYQGMQAVTVHGDATSAAWTYNLTGKQQLTEDRTFADMYSVKATIAKALLRCDNAEVIHKALSCSNNTEMLESQFDWEWYHIEPSEQWTAAALALYAASPDTLSASALAMLKRNSAEKLKEIQQQAVPDNIEAALAQEPELGKDAGDPGCWSYIYSLKQALLKETARAEYWKSVAVKRAGGAVQ